MKEALEAIMLICFGLSWPISLIKNVKAKSAKNMSFRFILLIIIGYIAGIFAKIISHSFNYVLIIYLINLLIVSGNLVIYFVHKKYDRS
ncbi:MAG: PQ-loop domain-containing transporter [Treponemataceae bacterium]|nr:PQ-loop domain-containing transporter [Treponemataceae bacterium]